MSSSRAAKEENWQDVFYRAKEGDVDARNQIVSDNLGLIYLVLKRFGGRGYDMEDLFQIGAIGLMKAAERFDPERKFAFSTYAVPMIIGEIRRYLRDDGMIHISRQLKEHARKIAVARERIKRETNEEPTLFMLQQETGLSKEDILSAADVNVTVESIYHPIGNGSDSGEKELTLADQLVDEQSSELELIDKITVKQMMERLNEEERLLLSLRYMEGRTQKEVAEVLGKNQVAVSRMEKKILLCLRQQFDYNMY